MKDTSKVIAEQSEMGLSLEDLIQRGARELIQRAIEVEVQELLGEYGNVKMLGGQRALVRNGCPLERQVDSVSRRPEPHHSCPANDS